MNREIPGMFYDPVKKKYFKIEANHTAPAGATYSQDKVQGIKRKQEETDKRKQIAKRVAKEKIQKASFYQHPLVGTGREIGTWVLPGTTRLDQQAQVFGSELRNKKLHLFNIRRFSNIRHIERTQDGKLIVGGSKGAGATLSIVYPKFENEEWAYQRDLEKIIWSKPNTMSSMSLGPTGHILSTFHPEIYFLTKIDIRRVPMIDELRHATSQSNNYPAASIPFTPCQELERSTLWASAASPISDKALFAIGADKGLFFLTGEGAAWEYTIDWSSIRPSKPNHHVLSLEWVDPNIIACGMRNSTVEFRDLREQEGTPSLSFCHSESAQAIHRADERRLVVAGPQAMTMYDMRFSPRSDNPCGPLKSRMIKQKNAYLTFPDYKPIPTPSFDTCQELGLLVSASRRKVQLFSMQTGLPVASPLTKHRYNFDVNCVKFDYHQSDGSTHFRGSQTPTVLVSAGAALDQWAW